MPLFGVMAVQEPLIVTLWHEAQTPISTLSLIIMGCYFGGRLLSLFYSDKIGLQHVWVLALLAQTVLLTCLGLLFIEPMSNSQKDFRFAVLCLYFVIFPVFKSTMAGLAHEIFGSQVRLVVIGILTFVFGLAGVIGPVAVDAIHTHFNSYMMFFFGSAVLSLIGALAVLAVCLLPVTSHEAVLNRSIQNSTQGNTANNVSH
jgi:MFS family permease